MEAYIRLARWQDRILTPEKDNLPGLSGSILVHRYRQNYGIPDETEITENMVVSHWKLEMQLARGLLETNEQDRWVAFERAYAKLYDECPWLNSAVGQINETAPERRYRSWVRAIGPPPKDIYEIGSGTGTMIEYLASLGYRCKGIEITKQRGEVHVGDPVPGLSWGISDGVHLDRLESPSSYDVIISDQVIEHLHPDDLQTHLRGAFVILRCGGFYLLQTPHRFTGPHDISRVFDCSETRGLHLREYTYGELQRTAIQAGFSSVHYILPTRVIRYLNSPARAGLPRADWGMWYLKLLLSVERVLGGIHDASKRAKLSRFLRSAFVFRDNIFLCLRKDHEQTQSTR